MGTPGNPIVTERQAMIAIANQLADLVLSASASGTISFEGAIAIVAGALVARGADYDVTYGTLQSLTLTKEGRVLTAIQDLGVLQEILQELKGIRREAQLRTGIIGD